MPITINGSGTVTGISAGGLPDGCIVTADIADNNVTTAKIDNISVTEIKIADNNVTTTKIADNTITTAKIVNGAVTAAKRSEDLTLETAKASTSGTSVDFTGIPSWVKKITVMFDGVSGVGTSNLLMRIGSGSIATSGYTSTVERSGNSAVTNTSGYILSLSNASTSVWFGVGTIVNITGNTWVMSITMMLNGVAAYFAVGSVALGGTLDRIRITTVNGTDTFDAGTINIMYE
jgi:hypothetical protein